MTPARVANELQMTVSAGRWGPTITVLVDGDDLLERTAGGPWLRPVPLTKATDEPGREDG